MCKPNQTGKHLRCEVRADLLPGEAFRAATRYDLLVSGAVGREGPGGLTVR